MDATPYPTGAVAFLNTSGPGTGQVSGPIRSQRIGLEALLGTLAKRMKQLAHISPGWQVSVVLFHLSSQVSMPTLGGTTSQHDSSRLWVTFWQSVIASRGNRVFDGGTMDRPLHR